MRSALYYPHTKPTDIRLVKTALLLWDHLEFIAPKHNFKPRYSDRILGRAMELIGKPHVPNSEELKEVHERIEELVSRPLPPRFFFEAGDVPNRPYHIYPQKLLHSSWDLLSKSGWVADERHNGDYRTSYSGGLAIMAILADCCAGKSHVRVTDRGTVCATLSEFIGSDAEKPRRGERDREKLVGISLKALDLDEVGLEELIEFREKEYRPGGYAIRELRHRYLSTLEQYVERMAKEPVSESDAKEIKRQFADDMDANLRTLRRDLRSAGIEAAVSKEMIVMTLVGFGTVASWVSGLPIQIEDVTTVAGAATTILGACGVGNKYLRDRRDILRENPMAYLYQLANLS